MRLINLHRSEMQHGQDSGEFGFTVLSANISRCLPQLKIGLIANPKTRFILETGFLISTMFAILQIF
ncbi:hypothetical protein [Lyngbya sp. PCC 8106]|uniref:hypothetical protein n=1 Tax=Lyngbya sp. (strain PCC 8106) TaxID=313612 RepID=UPI0000EA90EF|nr:hypothetical protein [Lyngbya sp. PCC 8106]EAW34002.1 hypothetical protein L8106_27756 [Lyngbya sp. PCC 8106]